MMKKLIYMYCLSLAVGTTAFAQDKSWWIGPAFSPDMCSRILQADAEVAKNIKASRDQNEHLKLGYTTGIMVRKNLGYISSMETGLLYSNKGFSAVMPVIFGDQIDPMNGINGTSTASVQYHFKYVDLPVKINYLMVRLQHMDMFMATGVNVNCLVEQKTVMHVFRDPQPDETYTSYSTESWQRLNISPMLGMGVDIRLRESLHLQIEPLMRYGVLPVDENGLIRTRLWTFGINSILYFKL